VWGALERVQNFNFRAFSSRRSNFTQIFVESCVDFEVVHLSVIMVWRLPYPEIPTLIVKLKSKLVDYCVINNS